MSSAAHNFALTPGNWRPGGNSTGHVPDNNDWNWRPSMVPRPFPYQPVEASRGAEDTWFLFEERVRTGPYGLTRFPWQPHSPIRILVVDSGTAQAVNPRLRQFIQQSPPRIRGQWPMQRAPQEEGSGLTPEEQRKALNKLKKQIYNPPPKTMRRSLYYRDKSSTDFNTKEEEKDENAKGCAICLEDFDPYQEVLVTPCNHMFHNDCIVPWVKSNGQCPVCRFVLGQRRQDNNNVNVALDDPLADDLISLIRAMEEAFQYVNIRR